MKEKSASSHEEPATNSSLPAPGERRSSLTRDASITVHEVFAPGMDTPFETAAGVSGLTIQQGDYSASLAAIGTGASVLQHQGNSVSNTTAATGKGRRVSEATTISSLTFRSQARQGIESSKSTDCLNGKVTFAGQASLSPLPIPPLEDTLNKF